MGENKDLAQGLLPDVRLYLDITWADNDTDKMLLGFINRGMEYIRGWGGPNLKFEEEGLPKSLLLDYCRYARSKALDEFRVNYREDLLFLQLGKAVSDCDSEGSTDI